MKRIAVLAAFALLAACQSASTAAGDVPELPQAQGIATFRNATLYKTCDFGRAVYLADWNGTAIAVVENAPECAK